VSVYPFITFGPVTTIENHLILSCVEKLNRIVLRITYWLNPLWP